MGFTVVMGLRIAQFLFAVVVMGLSGYVFHWYDSATLTNPPSQINFLIATPVFTFLSIAYLEITPRFAQKLSIPYVHIALEILNTVFYFAGFVALSAFLGKLLFCRGKVCASARAAAVFSAFSFVLWAGTTTLLGLEIFKGGIEGMKTDRMATKAMGEQKKQQQQQQQQNVEMRGERAA